MSTIFALVLLLALAGGSAYLGMLLAAWLLAEDYQAERERLRARRADLQVQWEALQARQHIDLAFWQARQQLRAEAERRYETDREQED